MLMIWLEFMACAAIIFIAGAKVTRIADQFAVRTGISRGWVGMVMLASVTSFPELVTGLSATILVKAPDLTLSNVLGACLINLTVLSIFDLIQGGRLLSNLRKSDKLLLFFALMLFALIGVAVLFGGFWGLFSAAIFSLYLLSQRLIYRAEGEEERLEIEKQESLFRILLKFFLLSLLVISAGIWLSTIGDRLAEITGWGETFVGSLFISLATTLPEMTVSVTALRMGSAAMAIGNLLGSNIFNLAIPSVVDLFYLKAFFFSLVSTTHLLAVALGIIMTLLLFFKREIKWISLLVILIYILGMWGLYLL